MTKGKEYLDENDINGRQPEEISMMPRPGWGDKKTRYEEGVSGHEQACGLGPWRPGFLQALRKVWLFALVAGITSMFCDYSQLYLMSQIPFLKRQYQLGDNAVHMLSLPSPVASMFAVLFLSVVARRVHIPKVLAITSLVAGICSLLCVVPYIHSSKDLAEAPVVLENETFTIERLQFEVPSCVMARIPSHLRMKMMQLMAKLEQKDSYTAPTTGGGGEVVVNRPVTLPDETTLAPVVKVDDKMDADGQPNTPSQSNPAGQDDATTKVPEPSEAVTDAPEPTTTEATGSGVTIIMPDFEKLSKNPIYPGLVPMAQQMGIDLEKVRAMTVPEQAQYLLSLPPNVRAMLPNLKAMLGSDPDQYFFSYELPNSRKRRSATLYMDMMYTGMLSQMMKQRPPIPHAIHWQLFKEACPFKSQTPFHDEDHSDFTLVFFVLAMVLHGVAVAPRFVFIVTFIEDNTDQKDSAKHLGLFTALSNFGPVMAMLLGFQSIMTYITLEDTGFMTFLNPRWLPAWWLGFLILGLITCLMSVPMALFPKAVSSCREYDPRQEERSCMGWVAQELKGLFPSLFRLMTNGVFVLLLLGATVSHMAMFGILTALVNYVSSQFSLAPIEPGSTLVIMFGVFFLFGNLFGGLIASKLRLNALNCLKMAFILSCVVAVMHGANIGFGCDQPKVDNGEKIVKNVSTTDLCSNTCVCSDLGYSPVCGSDGITYYSACHAGCGYPVDGKFHDCKCVEDQERTVTPDMCEQPCNMYYAFAVALSIAGLALGLRFVPLIMSSYRCVDSKDVPVAVALILFNSLLFGRLISPYIYSHLESSSCLLERPECGIIPTCAIHDIFKYRLSVFVTSFVFEAVAAILFLLAFLQGRRPTSKYNERVHDNGHVKG